MTLDGYLGRNPEQWHGFTALREDELEKHYHFAEGVGRTVRGQEMVEYSFRALHEASFDHPFLFHFRESRLAFIENDFWSLDQAVCREVVDRLGEPGERLDAYLRFDLVAKADWIYPQKGLSLCVMPETGLIARWTAFSPNPIDYYCNAIRPISLAREF